jgi:hypothetical protein
MPTIHANDIDIYYELHGWDKPGDVLVLSNGVLMSTASWAYQTPVMPCCGSRLRCLTRLSWASWRSRVVNSEQ